MSYVEDRRMEMTQRLDDRIVTYMERHTVRAEEINWAELAERIGGGNPALVQHSFGRLVEKGQLVTVSTKTGSVWSLKHCDCAQLRTEVTGLEDELKRRTIRTAELNGQVGRYRDESEAHVLRIAQLEREVAELRRSKKRRIPFLSTLREGWQALSSGSLKFNA